MRLAPASLPSSFLLIFAGGRSRQFGHGAAPHCDTINKLPNSYVYLVTIATPGTDCCWTRRVRMADWLSPRIPGSCSGATVRKNWSGPATQLFNLERKFCARFALDARGQRASVQLLIEAAPNARCGVSAGSGDFNPVSRSRAAAGPRRSTGSPAIAARLRRHRGPGKGRQRDMTGCTPATAWLPVECSSGMVRATRLAPAAPGVAGFPS
jgi:hypothetical protein